MVVISVHIYGVKIIKKFQWERDFLKGGSMEPTLCTNGSAGYLMQLSVNVCAFLCMQSHRICLILVLEGGCIPLYQDKKHFGTVKKFWHSNILFKNANLKKKKKKKKNLTLCQYVGSARKGQTNLFLGLNY